MTPILPTPVVVPAPTPVVPTPTPVVVPTPVGPVTTPVVVLDYAYVIKVVIAPFCLSCHSVAGGNRGRINLETFANVIKNLRKVKSEAITYKSMPPRGPLPMDASDVLSKWLDAGAPETVTAL